MLPTAPRQFMPMGGLPGAGLPGDRMAQMAARRAFVALKLSFIEAVADLPEAQGDWLRHQVRGAEEPTDLWLLRTLVFKALSGPSGEHRRRRQALRRQLDGLFPDSEIASAFASL